MEKTLIFIGGGHAHLTCLSKTDYFSKKGIKVILISPSEFQYYSGLGPGILGGFYTPKMGRFNVKTIVEKRGGIFIEDKVNKINPDTKIVYLESGKQLKYDIISFGTGSKIIKPFEIDEKSNLINVKPIKNLIEFKSQSMDLKDIKEIRISVIGGGAAGVEITGNLSNLLSKHNLNYKLRLISKGKLLEGFPKRARNYTLRSFKQRDIDIHEDSEVIKIQDNDIILQNGKLENNNFIFLATGVKSQSIFKDSGLKVGNKNDLMVNNYLQSVEYSDILGGGDCIFMEDHDLAKVGVFAVRQNPILFNNISSLLIGGKLKEFKPQKKYLLILNLGDNDAVFSYRGITTCNKLNFKLKSFIDLSFMKKFQKFE
jgi:NADH dehydrogenase FAD-containing subunit